jgi:asparaginyl-tRNA synthetase
VHAKDPSKWQYPSVVFGSDLQTEHERYLAEKVFDGPVFVHGYPKNIKAFYMRPNDDDKPGEETVRSFDLLVPGVGELVGGSQREERLEPLRQRMKELNIPEETYWWYLDLRRYGTAEHSGYGLGFERLVQWVCGLENIRDAVAFPRFPGNADF